MGGGTIASIHPSICFLYMEHTNEVIYYKNIYSKFSSHLVVYVECFKGILLQNMSFHCLKFSEMSAPGRAELAHLVTSILLAIHN
jgi:hypothetical protein